MTATADKYVPRFYSEVVKEVGSPDDCIICASLELYDAATLGEGVTRDDGTLINTIVLRELRDEAGLRANGPLRLDDAARYLAFVSRKVGMEPPFDLDYYPGHGGSLRVTWDGFQSRIRNGHVAVLLGNPIGVKDATSPLRTAQNNDDYAHAIAVMDGRADDARVFDALRRRQPGYTGQRVKWADLLQFTSAKGWAFGSPTTIACAIARIGSETQAARADRDRLAAVARLNERVASQKAQTALATEERDAARTEARLATEAASGLRTQLTAAQARVKELEALPAPDCAAQVTAERVRLLALVSDGVDAVLAGLK